MRARTSVHVSYKCERMRTYSECAAQAGDKWKQEFSGKPLFPFIKQKAAHVSDVAQPEEGEGEGEGAGADLSLLPLARPHSSGAYEVHSWPPFSLSITR